MKAEKFSESLNQINDKYIEEAAAFRPAKETAPGKAPKKGSKSMRVWRAVAIAACALLAVSVGAGVIALSSGGRSSSSYYKDAEAVYDGARVNDTDAHTDEVPESFDTGAGMIEDGAAQEETNAASMIPQDENAKIIYSATLSVETEYFEDSMAAIEAATKKHGGYFENMDMNNSQHSYRTADYLIRIPSAEFEAFLKDTDGFGTITSSNKNAADVSDSYYDTESRLNTAKAKLARLQELLASAQNMSDIITLENEIANVQHDIDALSGKLKSMDSEVDYAMVSIDLREVYKTSGEEKPMTFAERISKAFSGGMSSFGDFLEDLAVFLAGNWLWILIVLAVIAAAIIIPIRLVKKTNKKK